VRTSRSCTDICRELVDLKFKNGMLEAENAKLRDENDKLKLVAKNSAEIAVRATGGTVEAISSRAGASVSNKFVHQQWAHVVGHNSDHTDEGIPGFLRRDKSHFARDDWEEEQAKRAAKSKKTKR
jgi:hypothetical protein